MQWSAPESLQLCAVSRRKNIGADDALPTTMVPSAALAFTSTFTSTSTPTAVPVNIALLCIATLRPHAAAHPSVHNERTGARRGEKRAASIDVGVWDDASG